MYYLVTKLYGKDILIVIICICAFLSVFVLFASNCLRTIAYCVYFDILMENRTVIITEVKGESKK